MSMTGYMHLALGDSAHPTLMYGLVRWGGTPTGNSWYQTSKRSVTCRICGCRKPERDSDLRYKWVLQHERYHLRKIGPEAVAAIETMFVLRLQPALYRNGPKANWREIAEVIRDFFGDQHPVPLITANDRTTTGGPRP